MGSRGSVKIERVLLNSSSTRRRQWTKAHAHAHHRNGLNAKEHGFEKDPGPASASKTCKGSSTVLDPQGIVKASGWVAISYDRQEHNGESRSKRDRQRRTFTVSLRSLRKSV